MSKTESHLPVLMACALVAAAGQWWWRAHVVEDAAIYWALADHLASGHGYVATLGGERVEAGSSPLWLALLTLGRALHLSPLVVQKGLGAGLAVWGVTLSWELARRLLPDPDSDIALVAPVLWSLNAQVALWSAAGLEGPLLATLVLWSAGRVLDEEPLPLSALGFFAITLTRPEGVLYGGVGALYVLQRDLRRGSRAWLGWWAALAGPWLAWQLWHYAVFAWPFSMPYYAKVEGQDPFAWAWGHRSWSYLRQASDSLAYAWWLPLAAIGALRRRLPALVAVVTLAALVVPQARWGVTPLFFEHVRGPLLALWALTVFSWSLRSNPRRALVWGLALATLTFAKLAGADWMKGWRWVHPAVGTGAVLVALGIDSLVRWVPEGPKLPSRSALSRAGALTAAVMLVPPQLAFHRSLPEQANTSPWDVKARVDFKRRVQQRLDLDTVVDLDVDMGANLWWGRWTRQLDLAGLVDIPVALHDHRPAFWTEYLEETQPDLAHVHGGWARKSGLPDLPAFSDTFTDLPDYWTPSGALHTGNWVARRHLVTDTFDSQPVQLGDWQLAWQLPDSGAPQRAWASWQLQASHAGVEPGAQAELWLYFVRDDQVVSGVSFSLGWATWFPPEDWGTGIHSGRYPAGLDDPVTPGVYDVVGVLLVDGVPQAPPRPVEAPLVHAAEVHWPAALTVLPSKTWTETTVALLEQAQATAAAGGCAEAEASWDHIRWRAPQAWTWQQEVRPELALSVGRCWAEQASLEDLAAGRKAQRWAPLDPQVRAALAPLAAARHQAGLAASDPEQAYAAFSDAVALEPWRAWSRRHAEEARSERLGLAKVQPW